jgi:hypothetical protein
MTQECTLVYETELPIPFTCADGTTIEKGAILMLSDPMTAALATGDDDYVAGIAAEEKIASDGKTKIAVYRRGIFSGTANGTITCGMPIGTYNGTGADNDIHQAGAGHDKQMGIALETAADNETFLFELLPITRDEA